MSKWILIATLILASPTLAQIQRQSDGVVFTTPNGLLKLQPIANNIIRVAYSWQATFFNHTSLMVVSNHPQTDWHANGNSISTSDLTATIDPNTFTVTFKHPDGRVILAEIPGRKLEPAVVQLANTFHIHQQWQADPSESLYGLGENQLGVIDIKNLDLDLWQHNGTMAIPFLLSSRGFGILWDNNSLTHFGDDRPFEDLPVTFAAKYFADDHFGRQIAARDEPSINIIPPALATRPTSATATASQPSLPRNGTVSAIWTTHFIPRATGDYQFQAFSAGGIKFSIDDKIEFQDWRQSWLPWNDQVSVHLDAGKSYALRLEWIADQTPRAVSFKYKPPAESVRNIALGSAVADGIDYYFIDGPAPAKIVAGYRQLTGAAPMPPKWALGLWQSRQRYETSQQSLDVINHFRKDQIPFDNIVQDWLWWPEAEWGSHRFDPERFPDPDGWIKQIHADHANLMISVWAKFYPGTDNFRAMESGGFLYDSILKEGLHDWRNHKYTFFDAFNADADALFWKQLNAAVFSKGVDAWWMDASEPDLLPDPTLWGTQSHMNPTAMGPGSKVLNAYPLMLSKTVDEGQRAAVPNQRVFILTRSAFAGQQRYSAASWSGDTSSTWTAMKRQIAAGLSFSISGIPYWTMDVGGFSVPARFSTHNPTPENLDEWREMCTRWFEFGAFCPLLRVHGEFPNREMWEFGGEESAFYKAQLKFDKLRYSLLPYIYSTAAQVTQSGATLMRPLWMEYPDDPGSRDVADEFLLGPSILVCPVTDYKARARDVYLPAGTSWYDFWSNKTFSSGTMKADAPLEAIPLFVPAGAILAIGPDIQYTSEKPANPITLNIYTGADGQFDLYEDQGVTNDYQHGAFSTIHFQWTDGNKTLHIGAAQGSFSGMLKTRTFNINLISSGHSESRPVVNYAGAAVDVTN